MIQAFGPPGGIVACAPAPYELAQKREPSSVEGASASRNKEPIPEWKPAQAKLREFWSLLGFEPLPASDVFALCLTVLQPAMRDVIQKYFERKTVRKLPVQ
jgi:hypothetical protein